MNNKAPKKHVRDVLELGKAKKIKLSVGPSLTPYSCCNYGQCSCGQIWSETEQRPILILLCADDEQQAKDWDILELPTKEKMAATARFIVAIMLMLTPP